MSTGSIISTHRLDNGLEIIFLDQSKQIAADRWYVRVSVQMNIPIEKKWFHDHPVDDLKLADIRQLLGDTVLFEHKNERNFVSADEKDKIIESFCDHAMETTIQYLGHHDFAAKYILKRYTEKTRQL